MHDAKSFWYLGPQAPHGTLLRLTRSSPKTLVRKMKLDEAYRRYRCLLESKKASFDFSQQVAAGATLLVGEGNLSFALCLAKMSSQHARNLFATTFEPATDVSKLAKCNASQLRSLGSRIDHNVDATKLNKFIGLKQFRLIIFQFPNVHSRDPIHGRNPNHVMMRRFLRSAKCCLLPDGMVVTSIVDSPYYLGAFNLPDAAAAAGFGDPEVYSFNPKDFAGYVHVNTDGPDSALVQYDSFSTWVFRPKQRNFS